MSEVEKLKRITKNLLNTEGVKGVYIFSDNGKPLLHKLAPSIKGINMIRKVPAWNFESLRSARDVELNFPNDKVYIRKAEKTYIMVWMGIFAPIELVKLICS